MFCFVLFGVFHFLFFILFFSRFVCVGFVFRSVIFMCVAVFVNEWFNYNCYFFVLFWVQCCLQELEELDFKRAKNADNVIEDLFGGAPHTMPPPSNIYSQFISYFIPKRGLQILLKNPKNYKNIKFR